MREQIERELRALIGQRWDSTHRTLDALSLHFVAGSGGTDSNGSGSAAPTTTFHIACAWRLVDGERILVGSGDLFTPADPDDEPETFDWDVAGANWLDVRIAELAESAGADRPVVESADADPYGGVRITFHDGLVLELFPSSTPTGHVSTEFWRFRRPGTSDGDFVVGTFGIDHEAGL